VLGQYRSTRRHVPRGHEDEERLVADITELARQYGRYGYRRIVALLRNAGWEINDKRDLPGRHRGGSEAHQKANHPKPPLESSA